MGHRSQVTGLDFGSVVDAGRNAMCNQLDQCRVIAERTQRLRVLEEFDQLGSLARRQGQRRNSKRGAFGCVNTIGLQHFGYSGYGRVFRRAV